METYRGDQELIAEYYACADSALSELHRRYAGRMEAFFSINGLSQMETEDAAQDVWIRVMNTKYPSPDSRAHRYDSLAGAAFKTWLFTIARYRLIDALRQHERTLSFSALEQDGQDAEGNPFEETLANAQPSPEEMTIAQRRRQMVHDGLTTLPPRERLAIALWLETDGEMTLQGLARALEVSLATAHRVLKRAFQLLRAYLEQHNL